MASANAPQTLAEVFLTNNRINLFVLENINDEHLAIAPSARSRNIGDQFAHLHNVRITWLETSKPALAKTLTKIEKGGATKKTIKEALLQSGEAMAQLLSEVEAGKLKGNKRGPNNFFAYLIAHEAHHRGQILLHLKNGGAPFDKMKGFAIWEWEKM